MRGQGQERDEKRWAQAKERGRRIKEVIESNKLKVGDDVLWTDSSTGEVINYGIITTNGMGDLWVVQSKPKQSTYIGDPVKKQCLKRGRQSLA